MKIAMNALFLKHPTTGIGQYLTHLLTALAEIAPEHSVELLGPQPVQHTYLEKAGAYPYRVCAVPPWMRKPQQVEKLYWEQMIAPRTAQQIKADIYHVPHFAPPLFPPVPTIVTIHDVIQMRMPEYLTDPKMRFYMKLVAKAAEKAATVITVSEHAKQDIIDILKIPAERIRVTYEAAGEQFQPVEDDALLAPVRERYGLHGRYLFYIGGLDHRKNVLQLVRAFAEVCKRIDDPELQLFISGNPDRHRGPLYPDPRPLIKELGLEQRIILRFVEEEDKALVYAGATAFLWPSLYEGFGLPPLEAMSCGTPVISSDRTSMPEVVGDAAILFDPDDLQALVEAICGLLANENLQADLRARSLARASQFSWQRLARETLAIYEETLARTTANKKGSR